MVSVPLDAMLVKSEVTVYSLSFAVASIVILSVTLSLDIVSTPSTKVYPSFRIVSPTLIVISSGRV